MYVNIYIYSEYISFVDDDVLLFLLDRFYIDIL